MQQSNGKEILFWLLRFRQRYRVTGASMLPLLAEGDEVLVDPSAYRQQTPRVGEVVVAQHPTLSDLQIIKRVAAVHGDSRCDLRGDNPDPTQSSNCVVPADLILGRVTSRFAAA